jgi:ABC-type glutathione transport system ATPase component
MSQQTSASEKTRLPLVQVRQLTVKYSAVGKPVTALNNIDFEISRREIVGILGESGSGKSTLALSLLGLLPANATVEGAVFLEPRIAKDGSIQNNDAQDLAKIQERDWRFIRGARIAMIFQEPRLALSPVMRVGDQIAEVLRAHTGRKPNKDAINELLQRVRLPNPARISRAYPHQLSGGELHRVVIVQALACSPELLIADEPTRSLDGKVQAEILELLRELNRELGIALLFITHNPALLAGFADRAMVMYAGQIVEEGPLASLFRQPQHVYTKELLRLVFSFSRDDDPYRKASPGANVFNNNEVSCTHGS